MRRASRLVALGGLAWLLARRRRKQRSVPARTLVGFADGSSVAVPPHAFEHEALVAAAEEALAP